MARDAQSYVCLSRIVNLSWAGDQGGRRGAGHMGRLRRGLLAFGLGAGLLALAPTVAPTGALAQGSLPGQNELESTVGDFVLGTCVQLFLAGTNIAGPSATSDLFIRCTELVHSANQLTGLGATTFSLGLTQAQLNGALVAVAHEESTAQGTTETAETQGENVANRLANLRAGGGPLGVNLSGLAGLRLPRSALAALDEQGGASAASGQDGDQESRLGLFLNGSGGFGDKDPTVMEAGFDFVTGGITAGLDYRFSDSVIGGVAMGYTTTDNDFLFGAGSLAVDAVSMSLFGTYFPTDAIYVDLITSVSLIDQDLTRNLVWPTVARVALGNTDAQEFSVSVGGGYDFAYQGWTFGPYGRVDYVNTEIDGFTERGAFGMNLTFGGQDITSVSTLLGGRVTRAISTDFGVLIPELHADWQHEYQNSSRPITVAFANDPAGNLISIFTDPPDRNYANIGASLAAIFPGGWMGFVAYETLLGFSNLSSHVFTMGGRIEF
jgi:outer membrane autotransporter protein